MSILTDIPQRQRFEDFSERGAFHAWMRQAIVFAVIACLAALVIVYFMDSRREEKEKAPAKALTPGELPVVADLPLKPGPAVKPSTKASPAPGTSTKSTKSGTTTKKTTTSPTGTKTQPTRKTTKAN